MEADASVAEVSYNEVIFTFKKLNFRNFFLTPEMTLSSHRLVYLTTVKNFLKVIRFPQNIFQLAAPIFQVSSYSPGDKENNIKKSNFLGVMAKFCDKVRG